MEYALDTQGFLQSGKNFIVKELAIIGIHDNSDPKVFLFQEPFPWQKLTAKYRNINLSLENNKHGLSWKSGSIPYVEIGNILKEYLSDATKVYVKGDLKKRWLEVFNLPVQDVASIDYTQQPIKVVNFCLNHKP